MGLLKNYLDKIREKKQRFNDINNDIKFQEKIETRKKNSNERELERYYEEERQKNIQSQLTQFRKQKSDEILHTNLFANNKNLFQGQDCFNNGGGFNKW